MIVFWCLTRAACSNTASFFFILLKDIGWGEIGETAAIDEGSDFGIPFVLHGAGHREYERLPATTYS